MKKIILSIWLLFLTIISFAQTYQPVGNVLQRAPTVHGYIFRFNLGTPGFLNIYSKEQIDSAINAHAPDLSGYISYTDTLSGTGKVATKHDLFAGIGNYWKTNGNTTLLSDNLINTGTHSVLIGNLTKGYVFISASDTTTGAFQATIGASGGFQGIVGSSKYGATAARVYGTKIQGFIAGSSGTRINNKLGFVDDFNHAGAQYFGTIDTANMNDSTLVFRKWVTDRLSTAGSGLYWPLGGTDSLRNNVWIKSKGHSILLGSPDSTFITLDVPNSQIGLQAKTIDGGGYLTISQNGGGLSYIPVVGGSYGGGVASVGSDNTGSFMLSNDIATGSLEESIRTTQNGIFFKDSINNKTPVGTSYYGRNGGGNALAQIRLLDSTAIAKADSVKASINAILITIEGRAQSLGSPPVFNSQLVFEVGVGKQYATGALALAAAPAKNATIRVYSKVYGKWDLTGKDSISIEGMGQAEIIDTTKSVGDAMFTGASDSTRLKLSNIIIRRKGTNTPAINSRGLFINKYSSVWSSNTQVISDMGDGVYNLGYGYDLYGVSNALNRIGLVNNGDKDTTGCWRCSGFANYEGNSNHGYQAFGYGKNRGTYGGTTGGGFGNAGYVYKCVGESDSTFAFINHAATPGTNIHAIAIDCEGTNKYNSTPTGFQIGFHNQDIAVNPTGRSGGGYGIDNYGLLIGGHAYSKDGGGLLSVLDTAVSIGVKAYSENSTAITKGKGRLIDCEGYSKYGHALNITDSVSTTNVGGAIIGGLYYTESKTVSAVIVFYATKKGNGDVLQNVTIAGGSNAIQGSSNTHLTIIDPHINRYGTYAYSGIINDYNPAQDSVKIGTHSSTTDNFNYQIKRDGTTGELIVVNNTLTDANTGFGVQSGAAHLRVWHSGVSTSSQIGNASLNGVPINVLSGTSIIVGERLAITSNDIQTVKDNVLSNLTLQKSGGNLLIGSSVDNTVDKVQILTGSLGIGKTGVANGVANIWGTTSGHTSVTVPNTAGTYNFILPGAVGTAGQVLTSQGGGTTAMTWTTLTGGTITNIATGYGMSGGPITTTGTLIVDTASATAIVGKPRLASEMALKMTTTDTSKFVTILGLAIRGSAYWGNLTANNTWTGLSNSFNGGNVTIKQGASNSNGALFLTSTNGFSRQITSAVNTDTYSSVYTLRSLPGGSHGAFIADVDAIYSSGLAKFSSTGDITQAVAGTDYASATPIAGTPTIIAGAGAGTSPTVNVTTNGHQLQVTVVTGTLPTGLNAVIATVTLPNALSYTPYPVFSSPPGSATVLSGASMIGMSSSGPANVTITSGTTAVPASTTLVWNITL